MSIEAFSAALNYKVGNATRKMILMGIANHAHKDGTNAWPSVATLAEYAECDNRTVQRHIAKLLEDGFIREGDQSCIPDNVPARRRPVVYDMAMSEQVADQWAADAAQAATIRSRNAANGAKGPLARAAARQSEVDATTRAEADSTGSGDRGDILSPLPDGPSEPGGVTKWGDNLTPRMSPKPSLEPSLTNHPTHFVRGAASADAAASDAPAEQPMLDVVAPAPSRSAKRRTQVPDDFTVSAAMASWASERHPAVDVAHETEQFLDYHRGKGSVQQDWIATWRTWIRNADKYQRRDSQRFNRPSNRVVDSSLDHEAEARRAFGAGGDR